MIVWKVYKTFERGGYYIIKEAQNESEAFGLMYDLLSIEQSD